MTAPEPGTRDLAGKVARARQQIAHEGSRAVPVPQWDCLNPHEQRIATLEAANWLAAIRAAGLAVVELPTATSETEVNGPQAQFRSVHAQLFNGWTFLDVGGVSYRTPQAARAAAADLLASAAWAERQGGEPR